MIPEVESKLKRDIAALFKAGWTTTKIIDTLAVSYDRKGVARDFIRATTLEVCTEINRVVAVDNAAIAAELRANLGEAARLTGMRITLR